LFGEGWDFRVFEVDTGWLFRIPKRDECMTKLSMERKLLSGLGEWVSLSVPNYAFFGELRKGSGQPFAGYRKLPGVAGDLSEAVDRRLVARQLGLFLAKLHTYPIDRAREAGVREEGDLAAYWRHKAFEGLKAIVDLPVDQHHLRHYLESDAPSPFEAAPRLVHNDLWAEHILIDPGSGGVSGIIDWGDAAIGDPAVDLAGLYTWYGESWLERVLESYSGTLDSEVISRARYLAACFAVHSIALGRDLGRRRWVKAGREALQWVFAT
jgi:aminoglycoside phosphotransferase (APT) family kinase protein